MATQTLPTGVVGGSGEPPRPRGRLAGFDGLRALAALAVLIAHFGVVTRLNLLSPARSILGRLDIGVPVFFVISGFLLYRPFVDSHLDGSPRPQLRRYLRHRVLRIYPAYWAALIGALLIVRQPHTVRDLFSYFTLIHLYWPGHLPAGLQQSWSLAVEVSFYALLPLWAWLLRRRPAPTVEQRVRRELIGLVGFVVVSWGWRLFFLAIHNNRTFGPLSFLPAFLDQFAFGMVLALVTSPAFHTTDLGRRTWRFLDDKWRLITPVLLVAALIAFWAVATRFGLPTASIDYTARQHVFRHLFYGLFGFLVVAPLALAPRSGYQTALNLTPLRWLGLASYGIFLWHESIIELVMREYPERILNGPFGRFYTGPVLPLLIWVLVATVAVAFATFAFIEAPAIRLAHGRRPPWLPSWSTLGLVGIVGGAFTVRLFTTVGVAPARTDAGDPFYYHAQANILAAGHGFLEPLNWVANQREIATALHGPLYSLYLSFFSRLGATTYIDHKLASCLVGTAAVLVIALIARHVAGPKAMLIAGGLAATYANLWIIDGILYSEGLFMLLVALTILLVYRWKDRPTLPGAAMTGGLIALAALVRGEALLLLPLLVLPWMGFDRRLTTKARVLMPAAALVAALAVLAPWQIRNAVRFDATVPLSTNASELQVYSNCDDTYHGKFLGYWLFDCQQRIREKQGEPPGDEAQKARYWQKVGFDYARGHLSRLPVVVAARVGRQWEVFRPLQNAELSSIEGRPLWVSRLGLVQYWAMMPFAVAGVVILRRRKVRLLPLLVQVVVVTVTAAYAYGTIRFRTPAEISLVVLAAVGLVPVTQRALPYVRALKRPLPVADPSAFVLGGRRTSTTLPPPAAPDLELAPDHELEPVPASIEDPDDRPWWQPRWSSVLALGTIAALVLVPLRGLYRTPGAPMEEGFMLSFPERILKGAVPNVDFLHLYGPGALQFLAGVYKVFGVRLEAERTVGLLQHLLIIFAVYAIARIWGRAVATACAAASVFLVLTPINLIALAWNGGVGLGLWSVICCLRAGADGTRHPRRWYVAAGLLAGLSLAYRPDLVVALALAHGFLFWRRRRDTWLPALGGLAVGLAPYYWQLATAGFGPSFRGMVTDPVFRLRAGRQLPRPPSWGHVDGALQAIAERVPPWWRLPHTTASHQIFLWFFLVPLAAVFVFAVAIVRYRRRPDAHARVLLAAALFALGLLPQAFQRPDTAHFAWVSFLPIALLPGVIAELIAMVRPRWPSATRLVAGAGVVFVGIFLLVIPFFTYRDYVLHVRQSVGSLPPGLELKRGDRTFYLGDVPPWLASKALIADLSRLSKPGQRLFVGPMDLRQTAYSDIDFYYLFPELTPATYFMEMDPGVANANGARLARDVDSADWLVLDRFWSGWIEPNTSMDFRSDLPNQAVQEHFCLVGSYQHDLARLYKRCAGGGAPGPYDAPYEPKYDPAVDAGVPIPPRPKP